MSLDANNICIHYTAIYVVKIVKILFKKVIFIIFVNNQNTIFHENNAYVYEDEFKTKNCKT